MTEYSKSLGCGSYCNLKYIIIKLGHCLYIYNFSCDSILLCVGANGQNYSVTIEVHPNLANYTVGNTVTLECVVDPVITDTSITPMYSWQCDTGCFADGMTTPTLTQRLTDMDSGGIECSVTIDGDVYLSDNMFDLQVSQGIKCM